MFQPTIFKNANLICSFEFYTPTIKIGYFMQNFFFVFSTFSDNDLKSW